MLYDYFTIFLHYLSTTRESSTPFAQIKSSPKAAHTLTKRHHSTTMCSMVLKETLAYYTVDNGAAFCTFFDATKAFDCVDFCKLFRELLKRKIPTIHIRLLLNMYTNRTARVNWNVAFSQSFGIRN